MLTVGSFAGRAPEMLAFLKKLAEMESPSHEKAAVDRLGSFIAETMKDLGAEVSVESCEEVGDLTLARWHGDPAHGQITLLFHIDTVYPLGTIEERPLMERDGRLYGPGVLDMKGGTAVFWGAMNALKESGQLPDRPIAALFTTDEEIGSYASIEMICKLALESAVVFCLEPAMPDGSLKTWRKGVGDYSITAHGRAAHAGADHKNGRNAIEELAHQILKVQALTDYEKGTTLNVGVIKGGTASNVVPEQARMDVDLRVMAQAEADRVDAFMRSLKPVINGVSLEVSGGINRPPMPRDERMIETFRKASDIAAKIGIHLTEGGTGGGSDANFVAPLGIPVLDGLGLVGANMHSEEEYVLIDSLAPRAALLAALLREW
jgi:glutamate carboxypeptidase